MVWTKGEKKLLQRVRYEKIACYIENSVIRILFDEAKSSKQYLQVYMCNNKKKKFHWALHTKIIQ